jgi:hypothetical protein
MTDLPQVYRAILRGNSGYITMVCYTQEERDEAMSLINGLDEDGLIEGFDIVAAQVPD